MRVTRIVCSKNVNASKHARLSEQAGRLGQVRSKVWREYGSVSGVGVRDRAIRDRWLREGKLRDGTADRSCRIELTADGPDCRTRTPASANAVAESEISDHAQQ